MPQEGLAKGGFRTCGEPVRGEGEAWGFFRKDDVLWEVDAQVTGESRTIVDLSKYPGQFGTMYKLEGSGCTDSNHDGVAAAASSIASVPAVSNAPSPDAGPSAGDEAREATATPKAPSKKAARPEAASGGVPQAVVQRIVRQNFGRMRLCYENGLRKKP